MMFHRKLITGLCFTVVVICEVELTPIVTISPENELTTTTENIGITAASGQTPPSTSSTIASFSTTNNAVKVTAAKLGGHETKFDELPLKGNDSFNKNGTTEKIQPITRSAGTEIENQTQSENATIPELITKTTSSASNQNDTDTTEVTELLVTSQSLPLKGVEGVTKLHEKITTVSPLPQTENQTIVNNPVRIIISNNSSPNETEGSYKDKAPPQFHPYIEEILSADETEDNDTSTKSAPTRIKSKGYQSSQNTLLHPYGPLPKFAEKEMDKLRLNHWRVNQILKGGNPHYKDPKLGQLGTGKASLQGKYNPLVPNLGQKRASSTATSSVAQSSIDQDEFYTSVLASQTDAALENDDISSPSKLRNFFNWISSPLKRKPSDEDERLKQAKAQQPILPFALGYRGDFLFW